MIAIDARSILDEVKRIPATWHGAGTFTNHTLDRMAYWLASKPLVHTAETGTGKSTLLFSQYCVDHTVFTVDDAGNGDSLARVRQSPLLGKGVQFVIGPTQRTLSSYTFNAKLDAVLLDGPHGFPFPELEYWCFYPHIRPGGLLIIDDIHIPTIEHMYCVLREDAMWEVMEVVETTAILRRTEVPIFDPYGDGWWLQSYNDRRFPRRGIWKFLPSFITRLARNVWRRLK